jgi:hypothetical protein
MRIFDSQINKTIFSGREIVKLPVDISTNAGLKLNFQIKKQKIIIELLARKVSGIGSLELKFLKQDIIVNSANITIENNYFNNKRIEIDLQSDIDKITIDKVKGFSGRVGIGRVTISDLISDSDNIKIIKNMTIPKSVKGELVIDGILI